jgi:hypothetical protein
MRVVIQLVPRCFGDALFALLLVVFATGCMPHKEFCEKRDSPENTCYGSFFANDNTDCSVVPGCYSNEMCVAIACDPQSVAVAVDAGAHPICSPHEDDTCNLFSKSDCAVDAKCVWAVGCGGTPKVDCASFKELTACMNSRVCIWQIEN